MKKHAFLRKGKRLLSFVLAVIMACTFMPVTDGARVYAAEGDVTDVTYVNMPTSGTETVTLGSDVKDFKVYDDGGIEGNYSDDCRGYLLLQAPEGFVLELTGNMETQQSYDKLTIYDGSKTSSDKLIDRMSGTKSVNVVSSGNSMMIYFFSSLADNKSGFDFTVNLLHKVEFTYCGDIIATEYTADGGTVSLPSAETILGDDYVNGTDYAITYTYGDNENFTADTPVTGNLNITCEVKGLCCVTLINGEKEVKRFVESGSTYTLPTISELLDMLGGAAYLDVYSYTLTYRDSDGHEINDSSIAVDNDMVVHYEYTSEKIMQGDGTEDNPYQIGNAGQLYWFAGLVDGTLKDGTTQNKAANAVLTADITVNEGVLDAEGNLANDTSGFITWTPICKNSGSTIAYAGTFDGKGHSIRGLYTPGNSYYYGFFGNCNGTIRNLVITDSFFGDSGRLCYYAATFVGYGYSDCVIENCFSTSVINGRAYCGGIAGETRGTIRNCYFAGKISANTEYSNAIVSDYYKRGTLDNCYYLDTCGLTSTRAASKTAEEFASGEVAYLLQGEQTEAVWGQNLAEGSKEAYPVLCGTHVYRMGTYEGCEGKPGEGTYLYSNTNKDDVYAPHIDDGSIEGSEPYDNKCDICGGDVHHFVDGVCDVEGCGYHEGVIVNETYPAEFVYGDETIIPKTDNFTIKSGATPTFTWYKGDVTTGELPTDGEDAFLGENTPKDAGDYTLVVNAAGAKLDDETGTVYTAAELRIKVTIEKAESTVTKAPVAVENLTYDQGNDITLMDDSGASVTGGTLQYALGADGTYSVSLPTVTDVGTYDVYYKVAGDGNHNDTTPVKIEVTVGRADSSIVFDGYALGRDYNKTPLANPTAEQLTLTGAAYSDVTFTWYKNSVAEGNELTEAPTDVGEYYVVASIPQSKNYNASSKASGKITISQATPEYTIPTDVQVTCGTMLLTVALPEGFSWTDTDAALEAGELEAGAIVIKKAKYVPTDTKNYKEVADIEISIQVTHDLSTTQLEGNEGAEKHSSKCRVCEKSFSEVSCSGGTATCMERAVCSVCNKPYGTVDADNHTGETELRDIKIATCGECGYTGDTYCKACNTKIADGTETEKDPANHVGETEVVGALSATCTEYGCTGNTYCKTCGSVIAYSAQTPALGHDFAAKFTVDQEPTCMAVGSKSKHCTRCEEKTEVTEISKTDHTWDEGKVTKEATCTAKGVKTFTCTVEGCGGTKTEDIEVLGHDFAAEFTVDQEATCAEAGSKSRHCTRCDAATDVTEIEKSTIHSYVNGVCSVCYDIFETTVDGITYKVVTVTGEDGNPAGQLVTVSGNDIPQVAVAVTGTDESLNESVSDGKVVIPSAVTGSGSEQTFVITKIADNAFAGENSAGVTEIVVPDTVTEVGSSAFGSVPTVTFTSNTAPAGIETALAETATVNVPEGAAESYREVLGESANIIEAHTHSFADTWTYDATYHWHASTCGHEDVVSDKAEHTFGEWTVTKQATEDEKGEKERNCSCGYTETAEVEKLAHTIHVKDEGTRVEPTCEEKGSVTYKCTKCGEVIEVVEIDAAGHKWDDGKVTKEATETAEGIKTYTCSVCGKTKTEAIPKKEAAIPQPPKEEPDTPAPAEPEKEQPVKGDVVIDDEGIAKVEVADTAKKEVEYKAPVNQKAKTVTIPAAVKINGETYKVIKIDDNAFKGNKTVTKVTVGSNVKSIGKNAFSGATKLKTVTVGKNVTEIGANAFKGCTSLTKITLPAKVTKIGSNAFNGCKKLKTITVNSTKLTSKTVSKNAFKGISKSTTIKVPKKKLSAYKKLFKSKGLSSKVTVKGY